MSGTPTQAGIFNFTVKYTNSDGLGGAQPFVLNIFAPTAASVSIGGRVLTDDGRGLRNARVVLTDSSGVTRTVSTTSFGYYHFDEVMVGETYIISVISKRFQFAPQVIFVSEALNGIDFTALGKIGF